MDFVDFPIEFQVEVDDVKVSDELEAEAEKRLLDLAGEHTDLTGAAISITAPGQNSDEPFLFQVRVVVYTRPNDIVAVKQDDTVRGALKGALDAVERQVREKRKKLKEHWKRPDIPGTPADDRENEAIHREEVTDEELVDELKQQADASEDERKDPGDIQG